MPKYQELMPPIITCLSDGKNHTFKELQDYCIEHFHLTLEEQQIRLSSGQLQITNRVGWAKTDLKKAGLIENPKRGIIKITDLGLKVYKEGPEKININYLLQYPSYREYMHPQKKEEPFETESANEEDVLPLEQSPQEMIDNAIERLNHSLEEELLEKVMSLSPYDFEHLVARLLIKMGYGDLKQNENAVTKKTGDDGIDGVVTADKLGFDFIVIQAKQWNPEHKVSQPEVQKFLGACAGQGATKGVFITTADFTEGAVSFAGKQLNTKIVLINGKRLTQLMIEYNLGVAVANTYEVKRIDTDFFTEDF